MFLLFPLLFVELANRRQSLVVRRSHGWNPSMRKLLLSLRASEAREGVKERSYVELGCWSELTWRAPSQACACFHGGLWCRRGRNGECLGCLRSITHLSLRFRISVGRNEMEIQPWKIGVEAQPCCMSYDGQEAFGSVCVTLNHLYFCCLLVQTISEI